MSPRARRGATLAPLVLAGLLALAACGGRERSVDEWIVELRSQDPAVSLAAADALGRLGREDRAVVQRLVRELTQDRQEPDVSRIRFRAELKGLGRAEAEDAAVEIARVLPNRLHALGVPALVVEAQPGGVYLVRVRRPGPDRDEAAYLAEVIASLERVGSLELLAVVPRPGAGGEGPLAWDGDAASYDAFVAGDSVRWTEAHAARTRYVSSRPGWRVAPLADPSGALPAGEPERWLVVADAEPGQRFDEQILSAVANVAPSRPATLLLQVAPERQDAFESWTRDLVGRDVALVVDGRAEAVLRIDAPARDHLSFPFPGTRGAAESAAWARRIVQGTIGGRLRWPLRGEVVQPTPAIDGPFSRALAAVGPSADEALARIERDAGPAAAAARWAREEILRQRTRADR